MEYRDLNCDAEKIIDEILANLSYKPGWKIYRQLLDIKVQAPLQLDTTPNSINMVTLTLGVNIEKFTEDLNILDFHICEIVFELINALESHEVREWFKHEGSNYHKAHIGKQLLYHELDINFEYKYLERITVD